MDRLIWEATELNLHPSNINWEDGLLLSTTWQPAIQQLRRNRSTHRPNWWSTTLPFLIHPFLTAPLPSVNSSAGFLHSYTVPAHL
jgi:hypothetical protein